MLQNVFETWQTLKMGYYLGKPNKRGIGVIYLQYWENGKRKRVSTGLMCAADCFQNGSVIIRRGMTDISRNYHTDLNQTLEKFIDIAQSNLNDYICGNITMDSIHKNYFNMATKKTTRKTTPIMLRLKNIILNKSNKNSQRTYLGHFSYFERFMREKNITDDITSFTNSTMKQYKQWLSEQDKVVTFLNECLARIFSLCNQLQQDTDIEFKDLDIKKVGKLKDLVKNDIKKEGKIALTHEEINQIKSTELKEGLRVSRDLFIIQCQTGIRVSDFPRLLNNDNISEIDGVKVCMFRDQKENQRFIIPLDSPDLYPDTYERMRPYLDKCPVTTLTDHQRYNRHIKAIAKEAGLDREITETQTKGGKVESETRPLHDVITSHDARHSFITNCYRYFNLTDEKIIQITGHTTTAVIKLTYNNATEEDKAKGILRTLSKSSPKEEQGSTKEEKPSASNNYKIESIMEAQSVCKYLGIHFSPQDNFNQLMGAIQARQWDIMEETGLSIDIIKDVFNISIPIKKRSEILHSIYETICK